MTAVTEAVAQEKRRFDFAGFIQRFGTLGIFLALVVAASIWSPSFLTKPNILNVLRQVASGAGIMAVGMLYVILTRGIDLSVGSVASLGCVLSAYFIAFSGYGVATSVALVIVSGAVCGLVTGAFVAYLRLPSFVMSLAMMAIARGLSLIISAGRPIPIGDGGDALADFGSGFFLGLPEPVILMFAVFLAGGVVLNFTRFGRIIKAIGSNEEAVRLSGIAVPRYVLAVYVISGALAAVAGIISTSRTGVGSAQVGVGAELNVIAAVVIGGASLMGGRGGVINTLLGALVMGMIANIMNLAGVPGYHQQVYMGLIIVIAMLIQYSAGSLKR
ncbi:monosaccharide ABC transporter membrane protein (CUT2 family) [Roseiarcus fermentans]|uniref:Monosaccharide ABC transporter membrane protein (CUT2 family) n=1 Tax=Roseiarcus fermentans TaxID=1473586 RepID=A0A366F7S2_9HYPH|nr:ABC transporter permease [Roseiarcus fermentans]RBP09809.1 monosaccharide ABC transporter membrane protein (CUT2 family) [Roseiarcus fermentans]